MSEASLDWTKLKEFVKALLKFFGWIKAETELQHSDETANQIPIQFLAILTDVPSLFSKESDNNLMKRKESDNILTWYER